MAVGDWYRAQWFGEFPNLGIQTLNTFWYLMEVNNSGQSEQNIVQSMADDFARQLGNSLRLVISDQWTKTKISILNWASKQFTADNNDIVGGAVTGDLASTSLSYKIYYPSGFVGLRPSRTNLPGVPESLLNNNTVSFSLADEDTINAAVASQWDVLSDPDLSLRPARVRRINNLLDPVVSWSWIASAAISRTIGSTNSRKR